MRKSEQLFLYLILFTISKGSTGYQKSKKVEHHGRRSVGHGDTQLHPLNRIKNPNTINHTPPNIIHQTPSSIQQIQHQLEPEIHQHPEPEIRHEPILHQLQHEPILHQKLQEPQKLVKKEPPKPVHQHYPQKLIRNLSDPLDFSTDLIQNPVALDHINNHLLQYFFSAAVADFAEQLWRIANESSVTFRPFELTSLTAASCETCSIDTLHEMLLILLTIMEKYPQLISDASLAGHVATNYDRAAEYLNNKFSQFRSDLNKFSVDRDFKDKMKYYKTRERQSGIMHLLYHWYEQYANDGKVDAAEIKRKLMKHLQMQKRYWLMRIKGVI